MKGFGESHTEYRARLAKETMLDEVVAVETLEDMKILILSWIDDGSIKRRIPPLWERN
jgi:hypothetical protein